MSARPEVAFKIVRATDWAEAAPTGAYGGAPVDLADGYIHLSTADQLDETGRKHFAGQEGLVLLTVDLTRLGDTVVWEPSRGGALFPHIYGPLTTDAVLRVEAFDTPRQTPGTSE